MHPLKLFSGVYYCTSENTYLRDNTYLSSKWGLLNLSSYPLFHRQRVGCWRWEQHRIDTNVEHRQLFSAFQWFLCETPLSHASCLSAGKAIISAKSFWARALIFVLKIQGKTETALLFFQWKICLWGSFQWWNGFAWTQLILRISELQEISWDY